MAANHNPIPAYECALGHGKCLTDNDRTPEAIINFQYVSEEPLLLECGHTVCRKCLIGRKMDYVRCLVHGKKKIVQEAGEVRRFLDGNIPKLFDDLRRYHYNLVDLMEETCHEYENKVKSSSNYIIEEMDVRIESIRIDLEKMKENLTKKVQEKEKHFLEIIDTKKTLKTVKDQLAEFDKFVASGQQLTLREFYSYQRKLKESIDEIHRLKSISFQSFLQSDFEIEKTDAVGTVHYEVKLNKPFDANRTHSIRTFTINDKLMWAFEYLGGGLMVTSVAAFDDFDDEEAEDEEVGRIHVYDFKTGTEKFKISCEAQRMFVLKNKSLVTHCNNALFVKIWNLQAKTYTKVNTRGYVCAMGQLEDDTIVLGEKQSGIWILEFFKPNNLDQTVAFVPDAHDKEINSLQALPGNMLASSAALIIKIWSSDYKLVRIINAHEKDVNSLEFYKDQIILSGSKDKTIKVWNFATGQKLKEVDKLGVVKRVKILPNEVLMTLQNIDDCDWLRFYKLPYFSKVGEFRADQMSDSVRIHDVKVVDDEYLLGAFGKYIKLFDFKNTNQ